MPIISPPTFGEGGPGTAAWPAIFKKGKKEIYFAGKTYKI
jgi:hypothetical protein